MVAHHEQEHTDELGGEAEKIGQAQILKGLNALAIEESSFESSKGTQLDLVGRKETYAALQKIELEWKDIYLIECN